MGRAGFAKTIITPPLGVELCGYGMYLERRATAVHDDLFARALLLEDDAGERALLITLDLIGLSQELYEAIALQAGKAVGLDPERVLVSSTHTHSGPATGKINGMGVMDPAYVAALPDRCVEAAVAASALRPARFGTAHGAVRALGYNRVRADGPFDPGLHVLRIDTDEGKPWIVLFSHGCHPVSIDRRTPAGTAISADWPGQVIKRVAEEGYGEAMFRLGPCGDIDPVVAWHDFNFQGMLLSAEVVTLALLDLLRAASTKAELRLRVGQRNVTLPLAPLSEQDIDETIAARTRYGTVKVTDEGDEDPGVARFSSFWAEAMRANLTTQPSQLVIPVAVLVLNEEAWVQLPSEIFTGISDRIKEGSPFARTVVSTLAAHFIGYIPDREDFAAGGYASTLVPRALLLPPFTPAVGDVLVDGALQLLHQFGDGQ
jgi:neutral/alkaline ceramidase-like enzyme